MKHHKISKVLNNSTESKLVARKQIAVNGLSNDQHSVNKNIRFKTPIITSYLYNYTVPKRDNRSFSCCCK